MVKNIEQAVRVAAKKVAANGHHRHTPKAVRRYIKRRCQTINGQDYGALRNQIHRIAESRLIGKAAAPEAQPL